MKTIEFQDLDHNKISLSLSSGYGVRAYINYEQDQKAEEIICLHMSPTQTKIMIAGLEDMLNSLD